MGLDLHSFSISKLNGRIIIVVDSSYYPWIWTMTIPVVSTIVLVLVETNIFLNLRISFLHTTRKLNDTSLCLQYHGCTSSPPSSCPLSEPNMVPLSRLKMRCIHFEHSLVDRDAGGSCKCKRPTHIHVQSVSDYCRHLLAGRNFCVGSSAVSVLIAGVL